MEIDAATLERLVPERFDPADAAALATLRLHVARYEFAARHARPGRLLDLACGVGYGTGLLAERRADVVEAVGVDVSPDAVEYARRQHQSARVRFVRADALDFDDPEGFDTVVSLETIEHLPDPEACFARLTALLRPRGVLIASVPTTPSVDLNSHHLHDFTARSFRRLGAAQRLVEDASLEQVQRLSPLELARGQRFGRSNLRPRLALYYLRHPGAFARRVGATLRHGFVNCYLTVVWERRG